MTQIAQARPAGGAVNAVARKAAAALQAQQAAAEGPQQYLTFLLGSEMFAVGILNVKEIIEYGNLTAIPMMPPFIRGVINLRGCVVPVIDLCGPLRTCPRPGRQAQLHRHRRSRRERFSDTTLASWSMRYRK
jgi:hypothetical protein